jgi:hypothetical protein
MAARLERCPLPMVVPFISRIILDGFSVAKALLQAALVIFRSGGGVN